MTVVLPDGTELTGHDALNALQEYGNSLPDVIVEMRGFVRDSDGNIVITNDEDMKNIHPDDWNNAMSEADRQYLIAKHGEHNKPEGV